MKQKSKKRARIEMSRQSLLRSSLSFVRQLGGHSKPIKACAYNSNRHHVATCDRETLRIWSFRKELKKIILQRCSKHNSAYPPDIKQLFYYRKEDLYIAVCSGDPTKPELYSNSGQAMVFHASLLKAMNPVQVSNESPIIASVFDQDREELIIYSSNGELRVWTFARDIQSDIVSGKENGKGEGILTLSLKRSLSNPISQHNILSISSNETFQLLFTAGNESEIVHVWNFKDQPSQIFDEIHLNKRESKVTAICYSGERKELIVGYDDGSVDVYVYAIMPIHACEQKELVTTVIAHEGTVNYILNLLPFCGSISCGNDNIIRHWDPRNGEENGRYQHVHKPAPPSYVPHNKLLNTVTTSFMVPVCIDTLDFYKQLLLCITGELITVIEVNHPCKPFAQATDAVISLAPAPGQLAPIKYSSLQNRANVTQGIHHTVCLSQNNEIQVMDAATGMVAFKFSLPDREEFSFATEQKNQHLDVTMRDETEQNGTNKDQMNHVDSSIAKPNVSILPQLKASNETRASVTCHQWHEGIKRHIIGWSDGKVDLLDNNGKILNSFLKNKAESVSNSVAPVVSFCIVQIRGETASSLRKTEQEYVQSNYYTPLEAVSDNQELNSAFKDFQNSVNSEISSLCAEKTVKNMSKDNIFLASLNKPKIPRITSADKKNDRPRRSKHHIYIGSNEGRLRVWDIESNNKLSEINAHSGAVIKVAHIRPVSKNLNRQNDTLVNFPERECVLTAGSDGFVKVWDQNNFQLLGFILASPNPKNLELGESDIIANSTQRQLLSALYVPKDSGIVVLGFDNGVVQTWPLPVPGINFQSKSPVQSCLEPLFSIRGHSKEVTEIAGSEFQSRILATASKDHTVVIWVQNLSTGELVKVQRLLFRKQITCICFSPVCDDIIISSDSSLSYVPGWQDYAYCQKMMDKGNVYTYQKSKFDLTEGKVKKKTKIKIPDGLEKFDEVEVEIPMATPLEEKNDLKTEPERAQFKLMSETHVSESHFQLNALVPIQIEILRNAFRAYLSNHVDDQTVRVSVEDFQDHNFHEKNTKETIISRSNLIPILSNLGFTGLTEDMIESVLNRDKIIIPNEIITFEDVLTTANAFINSPEAEELTRAAVTLSRAKTSNSLSSGLASSHPNYYSKTPPQLLKKYSDMCQSRGVVTYNEMGERCFIKTRNIQPTPNERKKIADPVIEKVKRESQMRNGLYHQKEANGYKTAKMYLNERLENAPQTVPIPFELRKLLKSIRKIPAAKQNLGNTSVSELLTLPALLRTTRLILREKLMLDALADDEDRPRVSLSKIVYDWHLRQYGSGRSMLILSESKIILYLESLFITAISKGNSASLCRCMASMLHILPEYRHSNPRSSTEGENFFVDLMKSMHLSSTQRNGEINGNKQTGTLNDEKYNIRGDIPARLETTITMNDDLLGPPIMIGQVFACLDIVAKRIPNLSVFKVQLRAHLLQLFNANKRWLMNEASEFMEQSLPLELALELIYDFWTWTKLAYKSPTHSNIPNTNPKSNNIAHENREVGNNLASFTAYSMNKFREVMSNEIKVTQSLAKKTRKSLNKLSGKEVWGNEAKQFTLSTVKQYNFHDDLSEEILRVRIPTYHDEDDVMSFIQKPEIKGEGIEAESAISSGETNLKSYMIRSATSTTVPSRSTTEKSRNHGKAAHIKKGDQDYQNVRFEQNKVDTVRSIETNDPVATLLEVGAADTVSKETKFERGNQNVIKAHGQSIRGNMNIQKRSMTNDDDFDATTGWCSDDDMTQHKSPEYLYDDRKKRESRIEAKRTKDSILTSSISSPELNQPSFVKKQYEEVGGGNTVGILGNEKVLNVKSDDGAPTTAFSGQMKQVPENPVTTEKNTSKTLRAQSVLSRKEDNVMSKEYSYKSASPTGNTTHTGSESSLYSKTKSLNYEDNEATTEMEYEENIMMGTEIMLSSKSHSLHESAVSNTSSENNNSYKAEKLELGSEELEQRASSLAFFRHSAKYGEENDSAFDFQKCIPSNDTFVPEKIRKKSQQNSKEERDRHISVCTPPETATKTRPVTAPVNTDEQKKLSQLLEARPITPSWGEEKRQKADLGARPRPLTSPVLGIDENLISGHPKIQTNFNFVVRSSSLPLRGKRAENFDPVEMQLRDFGRRGHTSRYVQKLMNVNQNQDQGFDNIDAQIVSETYEVDGSQSFSLNNLESCTDPCDVSKETTQKVNEEESSIMIPEPSLFTNSSIITQENAIEPKPNSTQDESLINDKSVLPESMEIPVQINETPLSPVSRTLPSNDGMQVDKKVVSPSSITTPSKSEMISEMNTESTAAPSKSEMLSEISTESTTAPPKDEIISEMNTESTAAPPKDEIISEISTESTTAPPKDEIISEMNTVSLVSENTTPSETEKKSTKICATSANAVFTNKDASPNSVPIFSAVEENTTHADNLNLDMLSDLNTQPDQNSSCENSLVITKGSPKVEAVDANIINSPTDCEHEMYKDSENVPAIVDNGDHNQSKSIDSSLKAGENTEREVVVNTKPTSIINKEPDASNTFIIKKISGSKSPVKTEEIDSAQEPQKANQGAKTCTQSDTNKTENVGKVIDNHDTDPQEQRQEHAQVIILGQKEDKKNDINASSVQEVCASSESKEHSKETSTNDKKEHQISSTEADTIQEKNNNIDNIPVNPEPSQEQENSTVEQQEVPLQQGVYTDEDKTVENYEQGPEPNNHTNDELNTQDVDAEVQPSISSEISSAQVDPVLIDDEGNNDHNTGEDNNVHMDIGEHEQTDALSHSTDKSSLSEDVTQQNEQNELSSSKAESSDDGMSEGSIELSENKMLEEEEIEENEAPAVLEFNDPAMLPEDANKCIDDLLQEASNYMSKDFKGMTVEDGKLKSNSNLFGEVIEFEPLDFMRHKSHIPHWDKNIADSDDEESVIDYDEIESSNKKSKSGFVDLGDLSALYQTDNQVDTEWKNWPSMKVGVLRQWVEYFRQVEDMIRKPPSRDSKPETEIERLARHLNLTKRFIYQQKENGMDASLYTREMLNTASSKWRRARSQRMNNEEIQVTNISIGEIITEEVKEGEIQYYNFKHKHNDAILTITLKSLDGDSDLLLSNETLPTFVDYNWKSTTVGGGTDRIVLYPNSENYKKGDYYIGVLGASDAIFSLVVSCNIVGYTSEKLENVATMTHKFATIAGTGTGPSNHILREFNSNESHGETPGSGAFDEIFTTYENSKDDEFERMMVQIGRKEMKSRQFASFNNRHRTKDFDDDEDTDEKLTLKRTIVEESDYDTVSESSQNSQNIKTVSAGLISNDEQVELHHDNISETSSLSSWDEESIMSTSVKKKPAETWRKLLSVPERVPYTINTRNVSKSKNIPLKSKTLRKCRMAFQKFDRDKNGSIDRKEFHVALKEAGCSVSKEEADSWFIIFDKDGDVGSSLNFGEFLQAYNFISKRIRTGKRSAPGKSTKKLEKLPKSIPQIIAKNDTLEEKAFESSSTRKVSLGVGAGCGPELGHLSVPKADPNNPIPNLGLIYKKDPEEIEKIRQQTKLRGLRKARNERRRGLFGNV